MIHTPDPHWFNIVLMTAAVASVHVWYPWFEERFKDHEVRWVGFTGGIATGYVTLYLLPKLSRINQKLTADFHGWEFLNLRMYLVLLAGIVIYLAMEILDRETLRFPALGKAFDHLVNGAYSFLVGYVLVEFSGRNSLSILLITLIMGAHLLGMNHILSHLQKANYRKNRGWYALTVIAGAGLGALTEFPGTLSKFLTALLAGMILVNSMSDELPRGQKGKLRWYLFGVVIFIVSVGLILHLDGLPARPPN